MAQDNLAPPKVKAKAPKKASAKEASAEQTKDLGWPRSKKEIAEILSFLRSAYPKARCGLDFRDGFELLMATILSAQCQDKTVNLATAKLFKRFPDARSLAKADLAEVEDCVKICGFFRQKAKSLVDCAQNLVARFGGKTPGTLEELVTLRGVGRKTANVVLGNVFGIPGLTVDTHVKRISFRLGLTKNVEPERIELDLMDQIPKDLWIDFSHQVIAHGRTLCQARRPLCSQCQLTLCQART
ncbi:MAG: endonuclease III [Deltaproteobacteria bacterium]|jgi:endonuclease-3|nr:endonuclease III [Deltaproteobacteria bacterium]